MWITRWSRPARDGDPAEANRIVAATVGTSPPDDSGGWVHEGGFDTADVLAATMRWLWAEEAGA